MPTAACTNLRQLVEAAKSGAAERSPHAKANPNLFEPSFRTPTPNFFSLDNPILATVAGLMIVGVVSTLLFGQ